VWGAEKCLETNLLHPKNLHTKLVLKNMSRVCEEINLTFRQLDQFNTLLIDNCLYKCIGNVPFSYILPHPFDSQVEENYLLESLWPYLVRSKCLSTLQYVGMNPHEQH
jgi:hypothetical protein